MSVMPQGSILGPVMFNIFIKGLDNVVGCTLRKFADDTQLRRVASTLIHQRGHAATQRDDRLKKRAVKDLMKINKEKSYIWERTTPCSSTCWRLSR